MAIKRFPDATQGVDEDRVLALTGQWPEDHSASFLFVDGIAGSRKATALVITIERMTDNGQGPETEALLQLHIAPSTRIANLYYAPCTHGQRFHVAWGDEYHAPMPPPLPLPYEAGLLLACGIIHQIQETHRVEDAITVIGDEFDRVDDAILRQAEMFLAASGVEGGADFFKTIEEIAYDQHPDFGCAKRPLPSVDCSGHPRSEENTMTKPLQNFEIDACASAAHEVNRIFANLLGDTSHVHWDHAPDWQKRACRMGVIAIAQGEITPEQSHERWVNEKTASGWKHGPVKNEAIKEHPCLVAYNELPPEQRIKDELFVVVVKSMMDALWRVPQG